MKENYLPTPPDNPSRWGKWLLAAGLLLVAIQGFFQLYEVQAVFFPGRYHDVRLNLMSQECSKIESGLQALQDESNVLQGFCHSPGQMNPGSMDRPATGAASITAAPGWQNALQAAKQKRVYVAQKLNYLDAMLISMQRSLESKQAPLSNRRPEKEKTLLKIHEILGRCRTYDIDLKNLSTNLNKLESYCKTSQSIN